MSKKRLRGMLAFISGLMLISGFIACDTETSGTDIYTIRWETGEDGFIRYSTNDPDNLYWSFWTFIDRRNATYYEIECKKISGHRYQGYGMIFGASDTNGGDFYLLEIDIDGSYSIWEHTREYIDGEIYDNWITISDWEYSDDLNRGYNTLNTLKVAESESSSGDTVYKVYLNGNQVYQIGDAFKFGNRLGYCVNIGDKSQESFPGKPVDVRFRQPD